MKKQMIATLESGWDTATKIEKELKKEYPKTQFEISGNGTTLIVKYAGGFEPVHMEAKEIAEHFQAREYRGKERGYEYNGGWFIGAEFVFYEEK